MEYVAVVQLGGQTYTDTKTITIPGPGHTDHIVGNNWVIDDVYHWHECIGCDEKLDLDSHDFDQSTIVSEPTDSRDGGVMRICKTCGYIDVLTIPAGSMILDTKAEEFTDCATVWIDGKEYGIQNIAGILYVNLTDIDAKTMATYTHHADDASDIHTKYPVSMKVWTLSNEDGICTATRVKEFDDILQYAGCSIRIDGKQGIRMITSIDEGNKDALTGNGLADYTLKEYGTAVAWASQLGRNKPLVLGKSYVRYNYAYNKETGDDPIHADNVDGRMQYTNVLVGFELDQCKDDLAMRPYMILEDAEGNEITLYGGIVVRSIGYIATVIQNQQEYAPDTPEYEYLQKIIAASTEAK